MLTDSTLLQRYASTRDAEAFAEIVRRHAGLVFGVCRRICGNAADAEEVTQDCFLQLARHADRIRSSLPAWLHTVATHAAGKAIHSRRIRRQEPLDGELLSDLATEGDAWREMVPHVDAALAQVPPEQREALMLRYLEGRSQEEIAGIMGISQPTVSRRLNDGIAALRRILGPAVAQALPSLAVLPPVGLMAELGKIGMSGIGAPVGATAASATAASGGAAVVPAGSIFAVAVGVLAVATLAWSLRAWLPHASGHDPASGAVAERPTVVSGWRLQDAAKVSLTGEQLSRAACATAGWYPATVPGTVLTTLVDNKVYPEPLYGENNRPEQIPETLCRTDWWYRSVFTVPAAFTGRRVWLTFNGINYAAEVWVNGTRAGTIRGAFARGIFDVTAAVEPGKDAAVAVRISPQPHPGIPYEHYIGGLEPNGGITSIDGPTFLCSMGWDWMPGIRDRNSGIWQSVVLSSSGPVVLLDPQVTTDLPLPRTDTADVAVAATVRNVSGRPQTCVVKGGFGDVSFEQRVELAAGTTRTVAFDPSAFPALRVRNPRLWWPNGFGAQNLYTLHLSVEAAGGVTDARDVSFGIREITYAEPASKDLALSVNGVRVLCKGGNWGMDEAMKRIPRERLEAQIRLHQLANYTMIRNWVGQSTSEDFYDLCDRYGILVWDEFFQPNPSAGPNPTDLDTYVGNVREKLLRYRNHPSIALWCARNEGYPPKEIDDRLRTLLAEVDPTRHYQPSSTDDGGVRSGGPYYWQKPADYYRFPKEETFKTEVGSLSIPTIESIRGMMPERDWNVINDDWAEHDFISGRGMGYPQTMAERYGKIANLADFVRKGQLMNYEAYRAMYEGRLARLFAPVQGVLTWMSNPAQPSFVWQIYHYDLEPNAALFGARKACEPVHIQLNQDTGEVQVINNLPAALDKARARIVLYNRDGSSPYRHDYDVTAAPGAATGLGVVAWPATLSPIHFVKLELRDAAGKILSDNFYWRASAPKPDDFTALDALPQATLEAKAVRRDAGGKLLLDVTLRNPGPQVALLAHLQLRRDRSRARVLPVYYSDNYCSLAPQDERIITIEAAAADLQGENPLVLVDGWNVDVPAVAGTAAAIAPNAESRVDGSPATGLPFADSQQPLVESVHVNCGGGAVAGFQEDPGYGMASPHAITVPIDVPASLAVPAEIYRSERVGRCLYYFQLKRLPAGRTYTVRLHFAETVCTTPGQRLFNVFVNGKPLLADLDIFQEAGGANRALVKELTGIVPDKRDRIEINLKQGKKKIGEPQICGIEIVSLPQ